jgi:glycosyltransferase involved in cell wall biosynthesis
MEKISAIICAYNNEKTIKDVAYIACDDFFDEVIIINDGSTDKTGDILKELNSDYDFKLISFPESKGKGYTMNIGIKNAIGDIITFINADQTDLGNCRFFQLINPLIKMEADIVCGPTNNAVRNMGISNKKSYVSDMALLKKDVLPFLNTISHMKFGVETLILQYYQSEKKTIHHIELINLEQTRNCINPLKKEK